MQRVAAVWCDATNLSIHLSDDAVAEALRTLGATFDDGLRVWYAPTSLLEPVCSVLDRAGFVWAVDHRDTPRTWAERLCAELPEKLLLTIVPNLVWFLSASGERDHAAVLEYAWNGGEGPAGQAVHGPGRT